MTQLLEKVLTEVYKLSPERQDAIASIILEELEDERRWDKAFAESQELLSRWLLKHLRNIVEIKRMSSIRTSYEYISIV